MRAFLLVLAFAACDIPSQKEVDKSVENTVERCNTIVQSALDRIVPLLMAQFVTTAGALCGDINTNIDSLEQATDKVTETVLVSMGCHKTPDGQWDCTQGVACRSVP